MNALLLVLFYSGAGHGLAGILQVLLSFPGYLARYPESARAVQQSVDFLLNLCLKDGNVATDLEGALYPGRSRLLIHWCHGAAGRSCFCRILKHLCFN